MHPQFEIGQWVRSIPVGKAPAFVGRVVEFTNGFYVVRDDWNRRFVRTEDELETLQ